ncbi:hypothetical protein FALBO_6251 [Fusarium albosuccineum]|uniref:Uncharacterized protein n=1 Tax=Fusarium albosuccineum TaxID=1237068 RepID=A0A8H4PK47_9HYPO|nr:hypothetical protein FALBO_6251 [Fusarium albosuccineum]
MAALSSSDGHVGLRPYCGICGGSMEVAERFILPPILTLKFLATSTRPPVPNVLARGYSLTTAIDFEA